jgi:hypothetical protein
MVMVPKYPGTGYVVRLKPNFGDLQPPMTNQGYYTPYQFGYRSLAVQLRKSSVFDADATPTMLVACPASEGVRPDGYIAVPDVSDDPRPGAIGVYLPLTADLDSTDSQGIKYSSDFTKWAAAGVVAIREGDLQGLPLKAGETATCGDLLTVTTGGFYRPIITGESGVYAVAKVELGVTASTVVVPVMSRMMYPRLV